MSLAHKPEPTSSWFALRYPHFCSLFLYAAPAAGSTIGAMTMAQIGSRLRNQGRIMLGSVGICGLATIIFGFSNTFAISFAALAVTGLADAVSMMIRSTIRQLLTPDRLRGRMVSVNLIFFMGGPQRGEFEAGLLVRLTSTPISVISGGVATVLVVALVAASIPALRGYQEAATVGAAD